MRQIVRMGEYTVQIDHDTPILASWINDFYVASGSVQPVQTMHHELCYRIHFSQVKELDLSKPAQAEEIVLCNTKDPKFRLYGVRWEEDDTIFVVIDQLEMILAYQKRTRTFALQYQRIFYLEQFSDYNVCQFLDAILQPLFYRVFEKQNGVVFHSACIEHQNSGIMLMGETASGKTTALLAMTSRYQSKVVSWGRTIALLTDTEILCHGFPSYENIRLTTMRKFGLPCETARNPVDFDNPMSRVTFIPQTNPCSFKRIQDIPCRYVLALEYDTAVSQTIIGEMEREARTGLLSNLCLTPHDDVYVDWLPVADETDIQKALANRAKIVERLAGLVCLTVKHNGDIRDVSDQIVNYLKRRQ